MTDTIKIVIRNRDTLAVEWTFEDVTDFEPGHFPSSIIIHTEGVNYLLTLRECDLIEMHSL